MNRANLLVVSIVNNKKKKKRKVNIAKFYIIFAKENRFQTSGRVEHMFVEVHEEIELKLSALNYIMMPNIDSKCTENPDKSISKVNTELSTE